MSKPKSAQEEGIMIGFPPLMDKTVTIANWQDPTQHYVDWMLLGKR